MTETLEAPRRQVGSRYPWLLVGMLWFCGFFNYADRQAVNAVFPIFERDYGWSKIEQGYIAASFMVVYALSGPFAGLLVDRMSRRVLIVAGLGFWSLIAAGTGLSWSFATLLVFRAAEGLGESVYFPATMSILSDYHGPETRSRAMGLHQTSVYCGIVGGSIFAGYVAQHAGWRMPFYILGVVGFIYSIFLFGWIIEPSRTDPIKSRAAFETNFRATLKSPAAVMLMLVFLGANFVTIALVTWLPSYIHERFSMGLMQDNLTATLFMQGGSLIGVLVGGLIADRLARRSKGGRMFVQATGLICGGPCVLLVGRTHSMLPLILGLIGIGLAKGVYEANIFASLYDVIDPKLRGTAAGLMNTVGWAGASLAPIVIGALGDRNGLGSAIGSTAAVYVFAGLLAIVAAWLAIVHHGESAIV